MRLAKFIHQNSEAIVAESMTYAAEIPVLRGAALSVLRDHLPLVLNTVVLDLQKPQTRAQSIDKSLGEEEDEDDVTDTPAHIHGVERARSGLTIEQLVAEYRVLRSCVLRLWADAHAADPNVIADTLRFNEAIDQAVAESVASFAEEVRRWREIFLAVLGHDLRSPLNAMMLTVEVLGRQASGATLGHAAVLRRNGHRLNALLDSLLEYNKTALVGGMVLHLAPVELGPQCEEEIASLRLQFPDRHIDFAVTGKTSGRFDSSRVRQAFANLVSNAAQYSPESTAIDVRVEGSDSAVEISTENKADPIPPEVLDTLFDPLRRFPDVKIGSNANLGLGLFIVREIAKAHRGEATAAMADGHIRFKMTLPKIQH